MTAAADWVSTLLAAGEVRRGHTVRDFHQTIAEHSWRVAALLWHAYRGAPPAGLIEAALFHDAAEILTGDIPAPAKWGNGALEAALREAEARFYEQYQLPLAPPGAMKLVLKIADYVELYYTARDQRLPAQLQVNAGQAARRYYEELGRASPAFIHAEAGARLVRANGGVPTFDVEG